MGCYDMVVGNFVCPYCDNVDRIVLEQTKAGDCNFTDYGLGLVLDKEKVEQLYKFAIKLDEK